MRSHSMPRVISSGVPSAGGAAIGYSRIAGCGAFIPVWYRGPISHRPGNGDVSQPSRPPMPAALRPAAAASSGRAATYSISDLAREFALTTRAIRFYEDCGLVTPRRNGRARVYGDRERVRIKLILRGKRLGLALSEIGELLDLYEVARNERAQLSKFLALLTDRRARPLQP